jgi:hypothetical protein
MAPFGGKLLGGLLSAVGVFSTALILSQWRELTIQRNVKRSGIVFT